MKASSQFHLAGRNLGGLIPRNRCPSHEANLPIAPLAHPSCARDRHDPPAHACNSRFWRWSWQVGWWRFEIARRNSPKWKR